MFNSTEQILRNATLRRRALALHKQGWKPAEIAEMLGIAPTEISSWFLRAVTQPVVEQEPQLFWKVWPNSAGMKPDPLITSLQVLELKRRGYLPDEIASRLDVPQAMVEQLLEASFSLALNKRPSANSKTPTKLTVAQQQDLVSLLAEPSRVYGLNEQYWSRQAVSILIQRTFGVMFKANHIPPLLRSIREMLLIELIKCY